ncbi:uncharacterized protein LOC127753121 [Oryza glaberrima]|uniref:uncharacterized protein LOC127753121 n=1 Tax=Oryza glaberrima TaxID=4538 RepID=UPI00224C4EF6|nr:uncharacterized protein LOC127753121 [Oryza glaberrima]XP_052134552.1 uncharacterized protein LOC127753121 [Oryza glaberrima]XP_052134553.1 uncharacterized protein LOC127753121 [Oryza glaberrima]
MVGKQTIGINDPNRELLLLLRSMRLKFESLIPEWKPRQLLSLPDAVIRVCKSKDNLRRNDVMDTLETLSPFLSGSPRFRLKWSKDADTWRKDFEMHWSDQTHIPGRSSSIYWRKVDDEESKVSMIKECIKVFISDRLLLIIDHLEDKSEGFQREIGNFIKSHGIQKWKIGSYSGFICRPYEPNSVLVLRDRLVIGCDATIPLDFYRSCETASTVILLPEAHEVGKLEEAGLSEVNAEAYINFHNIKLPLEKAELCNEGEKGNATQSKKGKEGKQRKKWKKGKKGKKGKGRR